MQIITRTDQHKRITKQQQGRTLRRLTKWFAISLTMISLLLSIYAIKATLDHSSATSAMAKVQPQAVSVVQEPLLNPSVVSTVVDKIESQVKVQVQEKKSVVPKPKVSKVIYLTFDDGPGKYTEDVLGILEEKGIHATFFFIGKQLQGHEQLVLETKQSGNYVGLHSMSHNKKRLYDSGSSANFLKEYVQEQDKIKKITGETPWLIRAPYGSKPSIGKEFRDDIAQEGFKMWDWTVDSKDWKYTDRPDLIMREIRRQVHRDVEVILLHENAQTVKALPGMIDYLHRKGYSFAVYKPDQHFPVNFAKDPRL